MKSLEDAVARACQVRVKSTTTLEGDLLALEATATTAATAETTAATATVAESTTSTTTTATASTEAAAATTVAEATTAATAAAEPATTAAVVVTGLGIVKADLATLNGLAVQLLESLLGIINRTEGDVSEALGATRLTG